MKLREYLEKKNLSQHEFAEMVNVNREAVARWISGIRRPRPAKAQKIQEVTKGWVKVADLYQ